MPMVASQGIVSFNMGSICCSHWTARRIRSKVIRSGSSGEHAEKDTINGIRCLFRKYYLPAITKTCDKCGIIKLMRGAIEGLDCDYAMRIRDENEFSNLLFKFYGNILPKGV